MNKSYLAIAILPITLSAAMHSGCGKKDKDVFIAPITSQGYTVNVLPPDNNRLTVGENQIYKFKIKADEDIFIDRVAVKFYSTGEVSITDIEARDKSSNTLINSPTAFNTPPTFPLEMTIVLNSFIPQGSSNTYSIILDLSKVGPNSSLRMDLVNLFGRVTNRGIDLYPLPETLRGDTLSN